MILRWAVTLFIVLSAFKLSAQENKFSYDKKNLKIGGKTLLVEMADSPEKSAQGLMYRKELKPNTGMLFVFEQEQSLRFWMKNTFIPLSIAYFDKNKRLVDIQDMKPMATVMEEPKAHYISARPAQYALETELGWFKKNKIKVGDRFELEDFKR